MTLGSTKRGAEGIVNLAGGGQQFLHDQIVKSNALINDHEITEKGPSSQGDQGLNHPGVFTQVLQDDQDVIIEHNQTNSISHNSFNENRLYAAGQNSLKANGNHKRSSSYNLQNDGNEE